MKNFFAKLLATLSLSMLANMAAADFYVGLGAYSSTSDFEAVSDEEDDKALSVTLGWEPPIIPFISVEVSYHDLGSYDFGPSSALDVSAFSAQGVFAFPLFLVMDVYAKFGVAQTESKFSGFGSDDSTDPYYAIGTAFTLLPIVDLFAEVQRFDFAESSSVTAYGLGARVHF